MPEMPDEKSETPEVAEEEVNLVKDILRTFTKTAKAFAVYPKGNPIYLKFAEELTDKFNSFFEKHETLNLEIGQSSLSYSGNEVFFSEERQGNIALQMYVDGIRQLSFHKGLEHDEIAEFINIMRVAPTEDNLEDDVVTLLWEKDLDHISYFVPEEIADDEVSIEEALSSQTPDAEAGGEKSGVKGGFGGAGGGSLSLGLRVLPTSPEQMDALKEEADVLEGDPLITTAVEFLIERMSEETDIGLFSEYAKQVGKLFDLRLENKDIKEAVQILRDLNEFIKTLSDPDMAEQVSNIISRAGSPESIGVVAENPDLKLMADYLSLLNRDAVQGMLSVLGATENRKLRRLLCNVLVPFAKADMEPFASAIKDQRWFLVRNVVMILGLAAEASSVPHIKKILLHVDVRVRREAARALENIRAPETKKALLSLIQDADLTVRITALKALRKYGGEEIFLNMLEQIKTDKFKEKSFEEKKEYLETLGETGKEFAFPTLSAIFKKKHLFATDKDAEMKAAAAYGLGHVGTPEAVELLRNGMESKNTLIRTACGNALKKPGKK